MIRIRTSGTQLCEHEHGCSRPAEFFRTVEPPIQTEVNGKYCAIHSHEILVSDPDQMAELLLDTVRMSYPA